MASKPYHKYVFDEETRQFVGNFDSMYQAESSQNFDSWHQEDQRKLWLNITQTILEGYSFNSILDLGCGKGSFSHKLKKANNTVLGLDISPKAIEIASARYPDIQYDVADFSKTQSLEKILSDKNFDLTLCLDVLSYLENWKEVLQTIAKHSQYCAVCLYVPYDPIGFVRNMQELRAYFDHCFDINEELYLANRNVIILFGKSTHNAQ